MAAKQDTAIRKRQKIQNSNKMMFVWVAAMSAVVGFALVVSWFLMQHIIFQTKVINTKNETLSTLQSNNDISGELISNVRKYEADASLNASKTDADERTLQVILDALPSDVNTLALGASIQDKLVASVSGVSIESLEVNPASDSVVVDDSASSADMASGSSPVAMPFKMTVKADSVDKLKSLLFQFERSIRTISVDSMSLESSTGSAYVMTIEAHAYYNPAVSLELTEKTVKP